MSLLPSITYQVSKDCAYRLEILYTLETPVTSQVLDELVKIGTTPVTISRFSQLVPGGKDFFHFRISDTSILKGLLGGNRLVVTYGKFGEPADNEAREVPPLRDRQVLEQRLNEIVSKM